MRSGLREGWGQGRPAGRAGVSWGLAVSTRWSPPQEGRTPGREPVLCAGAGGGVAWGMLAEDTGRVCGVGLTAASLVQPRLDWGLEGPLPLGQWRTPAEGRGLARRGSQHRPVGSLRAVSVRKERYFGSPAAAKPGAA